MNQPAVGKEIAGVDLGDRDSMVCVIDGVSGEVLERATVPTVARLGRAGERLRGSLRSRPRRPPTPARESVVMAS